VSYNESDVRDSLSRKLDVLEKGLQFVGTEVPLRNSDGSYGRIDILARDPFGFRVVIEVKRSNQAARQAIHELFKYASLLVSQQGLNQEDVRCIIVSTEWHELKTPFSTFARTAPFSVQGYKLEVSQSGEALSASAIEPLPLNTEPLRLHREQDLLLFTDPSARTMALDALSTSISNLPLWDFICLELDHRKGERKVIYPLGLYLAMGEISKSEEQASLEELRRLGWDLSLEERMTDGWTNEGIITSKLIMSTGLEYEDWERGTPEKLLTILQMWECKAVYRWGNRVADEKIFTDGELIKLATGTGGMNRFYFHGLASPRHRQAWEKTLADVARFLRKSGTWGTVITAYLMAIGQDKPNASVSISIVDTDNLLSTIHDLAKVNVNNEPRLELVVSNAKDTTMVLGKLCWDGATCPASMEQGFGATPFYFSAFQENANWLTRHGFQYKLFEYSGEAAMPVCQEVKLGLAGELIRRPCKEVTPGVSDFIAANRDYVQDIINSLNVHEL